MKKLLNFLIVLSLLVTTGCASSKMMKTGSDVLPNSPDPEKATVVFMRPSAFGGAIQSSIYEIKQDQPNFIGIVSTNYKMAYQTEAGKRLFMVLGETANFMEADLAANHIYYVTVEPHLGFWKAHFSLDPIPESKFDTETFKDDLAECSFVINTPASLQWATEEKKSIIKKYNFYFPKWQKEDTKDKHFLKKEDGRSF